MRLDNFHAELTYKIIGAARRVHKALGSGFLEKVYVNSLALELAELGLKVQLNAAIAVHYKGILVGEYYADVIVDDLVILEIKAIDGLATVHEVQLVNYLKATHIELGLLINFGPVIEIRRRILTNDRKALSNRSSVSPL